MASRRVKEQEERLKNLTPKEREEHKKFRGRLSGTITSPGLPRSQLKRLQANNCSNAAETGPRMSRLKKTEPQSMSPNTSALTKMRRKSKGIVSISAIVIKGKGVRIGGNADRSVCTTSTNARYRQCGNVYARNQAQELDQCQSRKGHHSPARSPPPLPPPKTSSSQPAIS